MKCSACLQNICENDYDKRYKCLGIKEGIDCTCSCLVTTAESVGSALLSAGVGIAAAAGGVALTVMNGRLFAFIAGGSLIGAGSSLVMTPIQKKITGECMTLGDTLQDIAVGGTIGAVTGPIGSYASGYVKGATTVVQYVVRAGAGAGAGAVSGILSETARGFQGEEVSIASYRKAILTSAAAGIIGGASTQFGSYLSKGVGNGITQSITRIGTQAATAAATSASIQFAYKGEIDGKQVLWNTVGQIAVAATSEVSQNLSQKTDAFTKKINSENIGKDEKRIPHSQIEAAIEKVKSVSPEFFEESLSKANSYERNIRDVRSQINRQKTAKTIIKSIINTPADVCMYVYDFTDLDGNFIEAKELELSILKTLKAEIAAVLPQKHYESNIHALIGDKLGLFSIDVDPNGPDPKGIRGPERVLVEIKDGKAFYVDHTATHDYDRMRNNFSFPDPFDEGRSGNLFVRERVPKEEEEENKKFKKDK